MKKAMFFVLLVVAFAVILNAQEKKDSWEPFRYFVGKWQGTGEGKPGILKSESEFKFIFHEKYMQLNGKSTLTSSDKSKGIQTYEDFAYFSYDAFRNKFVFRRFNSEGIIDQYVLDSISVDKKTFIFLSEAVENIPSGLHGRITWKIVNEKEFTWTFELAPPGKDFEKYVETKLKRK